MTKWSWDTYKRHTAKQRLMQAVVAQLVTQFGDDIDSAAKAIGCHPGTVRRWLKGENGSLTLVASAMEVLQLVVKGGKRHKTLRVEPKTGVAYEGSSQRH